MKNESFLKHYGFHFKECSNFESPKRKIADLWGWLKLLLSLKSDEENQFNILISLKEHIYEEIKDNTIKLFGF